MLHPIGAAVFAVIGAPAAAAFAIFYGAGNGLLTIARGTVPLAVFGPHGYGERTGLLGAPARAAQAFAPLLFGLLLDAMGLVGHLRLGGALPRRLCRAAVSVGEKPLKSDPPSADQTESKRNAPGFWPGAFRLDRCRLT